MWGRILAGALRDCLPKHKQLMDGASSSRQILHLDRLGMKSILFRNPLTLSGGEQAVAALAVAIGSGAEVVAADCCFEQLDVNLRSIVVQCFQSCCAAALAYADNRADEHLLPDSVESTELPPSNETVAATLDSSVIRKQHNRNEECQGVLPLE